MYKQYECFHCDAVFKIKTLSDNAITFQDHYVVMFCPYCGGDIEDEVEDDIEDE